jgi:hypothetical protein
MDTAPLVSGHAHARKAIVELQKGSSQTAGSEHELAAGEFAAARKGTEDLEVLSTCRYACIDALTIVTAGDTHPRAPPGAPSAFGSRPQDAVSETRQS